MQWFSKDEVNKGRQWEFDYLKGIFMVLIYAIHAFQGTKTQESMTASIVYIISSMLGAALFIFVMGFGTAYSKNSTPKSYCKNGALLIFYQYLTNLAYVAALLLPYPLVMAALTEEGASNFHTRLVVYAQYTNIFFISGIIYFVLALFKKIKLPVIFYVLTAIAVSLAAPYLSEKTLDIPVVGYLIQLLTGGPNYVSFTPLYFLPYALWGAAFGKLYCHVNSKKSFYLAIMPLCLVIVITWWVLTFNEYGSDFSALRKAMGNGYINPNLWHTIASMAHILLTAAITYFVMSINGDAANPSENIIAKQMLYYSRHISKFYALHILPYFVAFGLHGYIGFEAWQCWLIMIMCMIITEAMVRGWNWFRGRA